MSICDVCCAPDVKYDVCLPLHNIQVILHGRGRKQKSAGVPDMKQGDFICLCYLTVEFDQITSTTSASCSICISYKAGSTLFTNFTRTEQMSNHFEAD